MNAEEQTYDVFQAIADPTRRKVLHLLSSKNQSIAEISSHFDISRTAVVKHLKILSEAGLILGEKSGKEKIYSLQPEPLKDIKEWLAYYERFWHNKLTKFKYVVENDTLKKD
ncbi:ArsR/SmtB family transcription factor [Ureibacillus manganicus]|uniref:ArsR family transcriptional regulator n=1 Tax=Ureibacillus manganicus DSM 26584 TaxID=1384049 RepID=A0A0A3I336_9BACL|nr:metalloregulator ArsR/SmtB family transcription factor [Ureibacillus manganicus]KGR77900.1 ArsR family transcriptional regulator [Ureibacillus manganicus DSM 26584]